VNPDGPAKKFLADLNLRKTETLASVLLNARVPLGPSVKSILVQTFFAVQRFGTAIGIESTEFYYVSLNS
jgi:hypothetical protein